MDEERQLIEETQKMLDILARKKLKKKKRSKPRGRSPAGERSQNEQKNPATDILRRHGEQLDDYKKDLDALRREGDELIGLCASFTSGHDRNQGDAAEVEEKQEPETEVVRSSGQI